MKRKYGIILGVFLLCVAICTYISWQVYRDKLPEVKAELSISEELRFQWNLPGSVSYESTVCLTLPVPAQIICREMYPGEWAETGDPILQVDTEQLYLQWLHCKADEETLRARIDQSDSYEKEILELQYATLQQNALQLEQLIAADGWICASTAGTVLSVREPGSVAAGVSLAEIGAASAQKRLLFSLTEQQARYIEENAQREEETKLKVSLVLLSGKTDITLAVENVFYDAEKQCYQCTAFTQEAIHMMDGQKVSAELSATSEPYDNVIPNSAVVMVEDGNAIYYVLKERQTTLGTEYYVTRRSAYVLEQNEIYTALASSEAEPVVSYTTEKLYEGCTVRLVP